MKKNLMFLTLLISVLMVSVVSAGITGYAISLREGRIAYAGDLQVSDTQVSGDTGCVNVDDNQVCGKVGETATTSEGASVTFQRIKSRSGFLGLGGPEIDAVVTPKPKGCEKITLKEGELFGEEYSWEAIIDSDSGKVTGILIHFGGDLGDRKILFGKTTFVGEVSITIYDIGNFVEEGEKFVILSVCPFEDEDEEPNTGGQCVTQNCQWRFATEDVPISGNLGATAWCESGEIAIQGSCNSRTGWPVGVDTYQNHVTGPLESPVNGGGDGWHCEYQNTLSQIITTETGALCCSQ